MSKICEYCSAVVDDAAGICPNCNSSAFRPGPSSGAPQHVTYNINYGAHHGAHPGYPPPQVPPGPYGAQVPPYQPPYQQPYQQPATHPYGMFVPARSPKSRLAALLLCFFLGWLGIHRFYAGKVGTGIVQILLTLFSWTVIAGVILGIWIIIDFVVICCGTFKDSHDLPITEW
ncbi:MAG: TM2 domain-containing protein [Deltaproteobacteria bacterium]|jgi:TM2 domain-containing membrane protein YozV|nr:TM2 domain-containing protein [Deltaproteobacteria bacterium]